MLDRFQQNDEDVAIHPVAAVDQDEDSEHIPRVALLAQFPGQDKSVLSGLMRGVAESGLFGGGPPSFFACGTCSACMRAVPREKS